MAAIAHSHTIDVGPNAQTGTSYTTEASIASTEFVDNGVYLIVVSAHVGSSSTGDDDNRWRCVHGSTEFTDSLHRGEFNADYSYTYSWFTVFTQPATAEAIHFQAQSSDGVVTVNSRDISMFAMRLDDDLDEDTGSGGDWKFDESTTDTVHTTTFSPTNRASVTWTPDTAGDDWLILSL